MRKKKTIECAKQELKLVDVVAVTQATQLSYYGRLVYFENLLFNSPSQYYFL